MTTNQLESKFNEHMEGRGGSGFGTMREHFDLAVRVSTEVRGIMDINQEFRRRVGKLCARAADAISEEIGAHMPPHDRCDTIVPMFAGWYRWRETPNHPWECVLLHNPTGDGFEVYQRGPLSDFPDALWGAEVPMPEEATDGDL